MKINTAWTNVYFMAVSRYLKGKHVTCVDITFRLSAILAGPVDNNKEVTIIDQFIVSSAS